MTRVYTSQVTGESLIISVDQFLPDQDYLLYVEPFKQGQAISSSFIEFHINDTMLIRVKKHLESLGY
jgi:hypothetical protein